MLMVVNQAIKGCYKGVIKQLRRVICDWLCENPPLIQFSNFIVIHNSRTINDITITFLHVVMQ